VCLDPLCARTGRFWGGLCVNAAPGEFWSFGNSKPQKCRDGGALLPLPPQMEQHCFLEIEEHCFLCRCTFSFHGSLGVEFVLETDEWLFQGCGCYPTLANPGEAEPEFETGNGLTSLGECLDVEPEVHLVHHDLYWLQILWDFTTHWVDLSRKECNYRIHGQMSQVMYESCHIYESCHTSTCALPHIYMSHVTPEHASYHTYI